MRQDAAAHAGYAPYREGEQPPYPYNRPGATAPRAPMRPFFAPPRTISELSGPVFSQNDVLPGEDDLAHDASGKPFIGQLTIVAGRVTDEDGRPIPNTLIEVWQTNASGKYNHPDDGFDAPLDPGFSGCGRVVTDAEGNYRFTTVKPGAYPVQRSGNWWRPPHIHFSLTGRSFLSRLVTQLYFPGEPLNEQDPIFGSITDPKARDRLIANYERELGLEERAIGYRFDIVLRGRVATPMVD